MKNILIAACIFAFISATVGIIGKAAEEDYITATVSIGDISVTVTPETLDYGSLPYSATNTAWKVLAENIDVLVGGVETDVDIKGTSTANWTLAGSIDTNQYTHKTGTSSNDGTEPASYNVTLTTTYQSFFANVASSTTVYFGSEIQVPSGGATSTQNPNIYLQASWSES